MRNIAYEVPQRELEEFMIKAEIFNDETDGSVEIVVKSEYHFKILCLQLETPGHVILAQPDSNVCSHSVHREGPALNGSDYAYTSVIFVMKREDIFDFRFRIFLFEGSYGKFKLYVLPIEDRFVSQVIQLDLRPLFQHTFLQEQANFEQPEVEHHLKLDGAQITESLVGFWLNGLFNEIRPELLEDLAQISFENKFFASQVKLRFLRDKQHLSISSDSVSTLKVVKNFIMEDCNRRGFAIQCRWKTSEKVLRRNLKFLRNKIREGKRSLDKIQILQALEELVFVEKDASFLSPDYAEILQNAEQIRTQAKTYPPHQLQYFKQAVVNLFVDWSELQGVLPEEAQFRKLNDLLENYKYKQIFELLSLKGEDD